MRALVPRRPFRLLTDLALSGALAAALASPALLASEGASAADPVKAACLADCKEELTACKADAVAARGQADLACEADPDTEKECRAEAKRAFKASKSACKATRKGCKRCCKAGAESCVRPGDLPPPFATGTGSAAVDLDDEGCLPGEDDVVIETDLGVEVELDDDTCFVTYDGEPVTGSETIRVDDAGGILAQGSPGFLQGVVRIRVDAPGGRYVAFDDDAIVRVELDDGSLPGTFEAVTWVDGDGYAAGASDAGERPEVRITKIAVNQDGPEEFAYWGSGPVGIRYVPPAATATSALAPRGPRGPLHAVTLDLLQAGLSTGFEATYPFLCTWHAIAPQTAEILAVHWIADGLPHGQTDVSGDYRATVQLAGSPTFVVESPFLNRLAPRGVVCDDLSTAAPFFNESSPDGRGEGGSPEEADLAGPYDGRLLLLFGGRDPNAFDTVVDTLPVAFPSPAHPVIRTFRRFANGFSLRADVYGHPTSVRNIASVFPADWRYEFDDRFAVVNVTPLFFDFSTGEQGWSGGTTQGGSSWGTVVHLDRSNGVIKLDGVDSPDDAEPNAWISRTVTIPAVASSLDLDVSAHDRDGANALYRVRLEDGSGSHTLIDWTAKSGIEGRLTFSTVHADLGPWAGETVTLYLEQDGNAPGEHEQIYYDNVWIH